jgi:hypothetical protein
VGPGFDPLRNHFENKCHRGEIGRRNRLEDNLSAYEETRRVESLKVGEPCEMGIPSQAEESEGVET